MVSKMDFGLISDPAQLYPQFWGFAISGVTPWALFFSF